MGIINMTMHICTILIRTISPNIVVLVCNVEEGSGSSGVEMILGYLWHYLFRRAKRTKNFLAPHLFSHCYLGPKKNIKVD